MLKHIGRYACGAAWLLSALACEGQPGIEENEHEAVDSTKAELRDSAGILPYPIKVGASNQPILNNGKVQTNWAGSMADLLAADAWAMCTQGVSSYPEQNDAYVKYLSGLVKSGASSCVTSPDVCPSNGSSCDVGKRWRSVRTIATCNGYKGTSQTGALVLQPHNNGSYNLGASSSDEPLRTAQGELNVAEVNLCVAQKLREDMVSAPGLLMTAADHLELLAHVRERVQLSMLQYDVIAGVLRAQAPNTPPQNPTDFGPALATWAAKPTNAGKLSAIGADAAAAIELHVDASRELGKLLRQYTSSQEFASAGSEWADGSWRARLTQLVYGGDPLGEYGAGKRWQVYGGSPHPTGLEFFGQVTENEESPQLQTLLGLARKADGLYFLADPSTFAPDPLVSAARLFQVVETSLRSPSCTVVGRFPECEMPEQGDGAVAPPPPPPYCQQPLPSCQRLVPEQQNLPTLENPQGSLLLSKHGITPSHVRALARLLSQAMPSVVLDDPPIDKVGVFDFSGTHEFLTGGDVSVRLPGAPAGAWYRLSSDFELMPRSQRQLSDKVSSLVNYHSTYLTNTEYAPSRSFLGSTAKGNLAMRELGAVPALALSRDVFAEGARDATASSRPTAPFFQKVMTAMPFASAAIGDFNVIVRPVTATVKTYPGGVVDFFQNNDLVVEHQLTSNGTPQGEPLWSVAVIAKKNDPFQRLVVAPARTFIDQVALDPTFRPFSGSTREAYFGPDSGAHTYLPTRTDDLGFEGLERRTYQVSGDTQRLFLADVNDLALEHTLLPIARLAGPSRIEPHRFAGLIDGSTYDETHDLRLNESGRYVAYGGFLGKLVEETWAVKPYNWSKAAFDGLGVKIDWFPPMTDLPGIVQGQTAASYFISKAAGAAGTARNLSANLVKNLIDAQKDELLADGARKNALEVEKKEGQRLCGLGSSGTPPSSNSCDTSVAYVDLIEADVIDSDIFCSMPFCQWYGRLRDDAFSMRIPVLKAVSQALTPGAMDSPDVPPFVQYNGGALQKLLDDQWVALRRMHEISRELQSFLTSGAAAVQQAENKLTIAGQMVAHECSDKAFRFAQESGFSYNIKKGTDAGCGIANSGDDVYCYHRANGRSFNPGPFYAQLRACEKQKLSFEAEIEEAAGVLNGMYTKMYGYVVQAHQAGDDVRRATIDAQRLANEARLASAKATFESQRVGDELMTRLGTYRRFHMYDAGEARAEVERARLLALYARRALEADYVVDLSTIYAAGPLVTDPPANWADKVYEPSLDVTALMNFNLGEGGATPAGGPDWFSQYVQKLDDFRLDYVLSNYSMTVSGINQLVELPPPEKLVATPVSGGGTVNVVSDEVAAWSFYCPATQAWKVHPKIGEPLTTSALPTLCDGSSPTKAKLAFALDPWGRLDGNPYEQDGSEELRYNMRALQFAVNLEGAGITTCATTGCTPPLHVVYNLAQFSPAWLSDVDQKLHAFDVNQEGAFGAFALARRKKVVLVDNDFDSGELVPFLNNENVKRLEFVSRPLGAAYELEFNLTNGVRIENVSNVQLLFKHSYWQ